MMWLFNWLLLELLLHQFDQRQVNQLFGKFIFVKLQVSSKSSNYLKVYMHIKIKIEEQAFKLSIGKGYNDWAWLSHYAARVYSKTIYPQGTYIPTILFIEAKGADFQPHPRQKIKFYLQSMHLKIDDVTAVIKIRKANHIFSEYQKKWELQAFGEERYFTENKYSCKVVGVKKNLDFYFQVKISFTLSDEVKHIFDQKKYPTFFQIKLTERPIGLNDSIFQGTIKLPYGSSTHQLFYYYRQPPNEQYKEKDLSDTKMASEDFKVTVAPKVYTTQQINALISQDMKISQSITKSLQQKEIEAKKRNTSNSLCCYTFEQLWTLIEENHAKQLCLSDYEESTKQRIKVSVQKNMPAIYQIFFYYFIVENQQKDKKEELGITYQHVIHFLRDYQILPDMKDLMNFVQFYNSDSKFHKLEDTLNINNYCVKFPQFLAIILRSIQFVQTSTFMMKGQSFDSAVIKILEKVKEIDSQEDQFSQFRRNIRQNPKIISFVRGYSQNIKKVYCHQAQSSIQNSGSSYTLMKEEIKQMLQNSGLTNKNTDHIIEECFTELKLSEQGILYYEFLSVIQWLAIATISSEKEEKQLSNDQEEAIIVVQKMKYLIDKVISSID